MGYEPRFGAEYEFFFFRETRDSLVIKGFRGLTPLDPGMMGYSWVRTGQDAELMRDIFEGLRDFDIELEGLHTETGPGVYEAAIRYDDALRAADKAALFKTAVKQIAHRHGLAVTFMAKFNEKLPGCSGHLHQSLWQDGKNAFYDAKEPHGISAVMRHYMGGQLALMQEITAMISPSINSYKRYVPGVWAPLVAAWGVENRACAIRVILGDPGATRIEYRQTAADMNPYIAMAACLGAGLSPTSALDYVAEAVGPPAHDELVAVSARLRLGVDPGTVWRDLAHHPQLGGLGRALARAVESGASVADAMERLSDDLRRATRADVENRARAVGVKAAVPLGVCLLPAFVLVGVVPLVAGAVGVLAGR
jgi:glutamine synthetase